LRKPFESPPEVQNKIPEIPRAQGKIRTFGLAPKISSGKKMGETGTISFPRRTVDNKGT